MSKKTWTLLNALDEQARQREIAGKLVMKKADIIRRKQDLRERLTRLVEEEEAINSKISQANWVAFSALDKCQDCGAMLYGRNGQPRTEHRYLVLDPQTRDTASPRAYRCEGCQAKAVNHADIKVRCTAINPDWTRGADLGVTS